MPTSPRFCLVANELSSLDNNGGIGTHNQSLAETLTDAGWIVHVLYCGNSTVRKRQKFTIWYLSDRPAPRYYDKPCTIERDPAFLSGKIYEELKRLNQLYQFQLVEFADWQGNGFRSVQAKRNGAAFAETRLAVRAHGSSHWCRDANHQWMDGAADLVTDFVERYAFDHADIQLSPSRYMLETARSLGWAVRETAQVIPYVFPEPEPGPLPPGVSKAPELVFFGRLEYRKGLSLFVEAVKELSPALPLTFLGREVKVEGRAAKAWLKKKLPGRKFRVASNLNREQALAYLKQSNRLAVIPSLQENFPFTVIECATNGIPFLASNVGGIPEILSDPDLAAHVLFAPTAADLKRCLTAFLASEYTAKSVLRLQIGELMAKADTKSSVTGQYRQLIEAPLPAPMPSSFPVVTIAVTHFNLGKYLPRALAAIERQTYPALQVLVLDDGSDPENLACFAEAEKNFPRFTFLRQPNQGLGAARNRALHLTEGKYFLPLDADNISLPTMTEKFVQALEKNPALSAVACFNAQFVDERDLKESRFRYSYRPPGGPLVVASMDNVFGDANALFRTADLRAVGGFETDRGLGNEDWEVFVKLNRAQFKTDVLPETLFFYRYREDGMWKNANEFLSHKRVLRQFFAETELPLAERLGLWNWLASGATEKRASGWKSKLKAGFQALRKIRN